jgi:hypothetical protein
MNYLIYSIILMFAFQITNASPFRVNQYPNGSKFQCAGCHINSGGGGARNSFGKDVGAGLVNGNVNWGPELASLDSDNDGFTNGEELFDPNGEWKIGDPNPGNSDDVTAPYDSDDFPTSVNNIAERFINFRFNGSNVFSDNISFTVASELSDDFTIRIVNSNGNPVDMVYKGKLTAKTIEWKGTNSFGSSVSAGLYFIEITSSKYTVVRKVLKI